MRLFWSALFIFVCLPFQLRAEDWCQQDLGKCRFYESCIEKKRPCGRGGYALDYGRFYCQRFDELAGLSRKGKEWKREVKICLQKNLLKFRVEIRSCFEIEAHGFNTHPTCYVRPTRDRSLSICSLPLSDIFSVLRTIEGGDLIQVQGQRQIVSVAKTCLRRYADRLSPFKVEGGVDDLKGPPLSEKEILFWRDILKKYSE